MVKNFHPQNFKKLENGKVHVTGTILLDAEVTIDPDGGGDTGGGGGGDPPQLDIELRERAKAVWIYGSGTPGWAISAARNLGFETVDVEDLHSNYPWQ